MKRVLSIVICAVILLGLLNVWWMYSRPNDETVRAEFLRDYPGHQIMFLGVGEGDGASAYYHIRHVAPGTTNLSGAVRLYLEENGKWEFRWETNE